MKKPAACLAFAQAFRMHGWTLIVLAVSLPGALVHAASTSPLQMNADAAYPALRRIAGAPPPPSEAPQPPSDRALAPPEPDGYRESDYRADAPATLLGQPALDTAAAVELHRTGAAIFVDVMPRAPRPENLPADTYFRERPRQTIPGATWLPDTGYGRLGAPALDYLAGWLKRLSTGNLSRRIVVFCRDRCWMSWNVARRARLELGYTAVDWYREGTDGWASAGLPLETVERAPAIEPTTPAAGMVSPPR